MYQNYPNPFNSKTVISYRIAEPSFVAVEIFNIQGQSIKKWENTFQSIGLHRIAWDAKDNFGNSVPSGEYLCRIINGNKAQAINLLYLK